MNKVWYLYIIRCRNDSLYTGITIDLERRFAEHQEQGEKCAKYLRGKGPLKLEYSVEVGTKSEATRLELLVKKLPKLEKELILADKIDIFNLL